MYSLGFPQQFGKIRSLDLFYPFSLALCLINFKKIFFYYLILLNNHNFFHQISKLFKNNSWPNSNFRQIHPREMLPRFWIILSHCPKPGKQPSRDYPYLLLHSHFLYKTNLIYNTAHNFYYLFQQLLHRFLQYFIYFSFQKNIWRFSLQYLIFYPLYFFYKGIYNEKESFCNLFLDHKSQLNLY